jgi:hypothetical protein
MVLRKGRDLRRKTVNTIISEKVIAITMAKKDTS